MFHYINIWLIVKNHFSPFRFGHDRKFSLPYFFVFFVIPLAIAFALTWRFGAVRDTDIGNFLTVFSVVAAVMTALMPVVQSIVGLADFDTRFGESQKRLYHQQIVRLQVLRELYAEISFSVILLVFALVPLICLEIDSIAPWVRKGMSGFVYFVAAAVALSFLHIIMGIYLVLEVQAHEANRKLADNAPESLKRAQSDVG